MEGDFVAHKIVNDCSSMVQVTHALRSETLKSPRWVSSYKRENEYTITKKFKKKFTISPTSYFKNGNDRIKKLKKKLNMIMVNMLLLIIT